MGKKQSGDKLSMGFKCAWAAPSLLVTIVNALINGYLSFYATNFMMIPIGTVGLLLMVSKIFDSFTDLLAGYVIDKTDTKLGKARPYQIATVFYGAVAVLLFCAPKMGVSSSIVYLFIMYSLLNSIFYTMMGCSEPVYLARVLRDPNKVVSLSSFSGAIGMVAAFVVGIIIPQMVVAFGTTREGWRFIAFILIIPFTILGMARFFFIKEKYDVQSSEKEEKRSIGTQIKLIFGNKYLMICSIFTLLAMITSNLGTSVNTYYFYYIFGDVGLASWGSLSALLMVAGIIFMPMVTRKLGFMKTVKGLVVISGLGFAVKLLNVKSIPLMIISNIISPVFVVFVMFVNVLLMECMDYGEWSTGTRAEGAVASVFSFCSKVGGAIGLGLSGLMMQAAGFDANLAVQSTSANWMMIALVSLIPAIFCAVMLVSMHFYDLDKKIEGIRGELQKKHEAEGQAAQ